MKTEPLFINKNQFVALLRDSGINDAQMDALHRLFEKRHPEAHEAFLRALQFDENAVQQVRERSRKAQG